MARSIAIVDDEPAIRANYVEALNRFGYQTQGYASRPDASRAFAQRMPELVTHDGCEVHAVDTPAVTSGVVVDGDRRADRLAELAARQRGNVRVDARQRGGIVDGAPLGHRVGDGAVERVLRQRRVARFVSLTIGGDEWDRSLLKSWADRADDGWDRTGEHGDRAHEGDDPAKRERVEVRRPRSTSSALDHRHRP